MNGATLGAIRDGLQRQQGSAAASGGSLPSGAAAGDLGTLEPARGLRRSFVVLGVAAVDEQPEKVVPALRGLAAKGVALECAALAEWHGEASCLVILVRGTNGELYQLSGVQPAPASDRPTAPEAAEPVCRDWLGAHLPELAAAPITWAPAAELENIRTEYQIQRGLRNVQARAATPGTLSYVLAQASLRAEDPAEQGETEGWE